VLPNNQEIVFADTVGFIRHLPHELVAAFKSTLQEASEADLLLHVIDANALEREDLITQVELVLDEIGAAKIPRLEVFNKVDLIDDIPAHVERDANGQAVRVWLSAETGEGIELLFDILVEKFANTKVRRRCHLSPNQGGIRAQLFTYAQILEESNNEQGETNLLIEIDVKHLGLLKNVQMCDI
jgi:GTP-binding protein HflX